MRFGKILAAASAAALVLAPVAGHAAQAKSSGAAALALSSGIPAKLSKVGSVKRAGAHTQAESKFGGDSTILLILAVILIGAGIFVLADNNDDTPTSP
jgi:O-acetylhomoserine/O-acetylserine sulfhydrylase-like pyridoxal-dependent enzyme